MIAIQIHHYSTQFMAATSAYEVAELEKIMNGLELRPLITSEGQLHSSLEPATLDEPGMDELVTRVEATPINPSL